MSGLHKLKNWGESMKKLSLFLAITIFFTFLLSTTFAAPVEQISYQKYIHNDQGTGNKTCYFRIYDAASGGNLLWTEGPVTCTIAREYGGATKTGSDVYFYFVKWSLGSVTSFPATIDFQSPLWVAARPGII